MNARNLNVWCGGDRLCEIGAPLAVSAFQPSKENSGQRPRFVTHRHGHFSWFLVLLFFAHVASATSNEAALRKFSDSVRTFQARFTQVQSDDQGGAVKTQRGSVWLLRPTAKFPDTVGKFRWAYEVPYTQLIVDDGSRLWVYDPGLKQVTVRSVQKALTGSPAALLLSDGNLKKTFRISPLKVGSGVTGVHLTPRLKNSSFQSVDLVLRGDIPIRMVFRDQMGDVTDIRFSRVKVNRPIDSNLFVFRPPKGVELVRAGSDRAGPVS